MIVTKELEIDMGHRLHTHKGKCHNIHGHRYKIEVGIEGAIEREKKASSFGMVVDFGDIKALLKEVIEEPFDHALVLCSEDELAPMFEPLRDQGMKIVFVSFPTTAEALARYWFTLIQESIKLKISHVTVWETPTSSATYKGES